MALVLLKNHTEDQKNLNSTRRSNINQNLISFKQAVIEEDLQFSMKSTNKLKQTLKNLENIQKKAKQYRQACTESLRKLKQQETKYNQKLKEFQTTYHISSSEEQHKKKVSEGQKRHIYNCQARVAKAAELNYKRLQKLQIPQKKSLANQLFKWILVAFYFQTEAKFYYPNFIEQVLQNDKGADLKERLGKINAYDSKQQQRLKTQQIVKDEQNIRKCEQFKDFQPQINILFQIAKLYLDSCNIGRNLRRQEKEMTQFRKKFRSQQDENNELMRDRNSLHERIAVGEVYLKQLHAMEDIYQYKRQKYQLQISKGQQFNQQLSKYGVKKVGGLQLGVQSEQQRSHCQCIIF